MGNLFQIAPSVGLQCTLVVAVPNVYFQALG